MGCGTNIVPGFNESNKIKDPGLQMKIDQEIANRTAQFKAGLITDSERRNAINKEWDRLSALEPNKRKPVLGADFDKQNTDWAGNTRVRYKENSLGDALRRVSEGGGELSMMTNHLKSMGIPHRLKIKGGKPSGMIISAPHSESFGSDTQVTFDNMFDMLVAMGEDPKGPAAQFNHKLSDEQSIRMERAWIRKTGEDWQGQERTVEDFIYEWGYNPLREVNKRQPKMDWRMNEEKMPLFDARVQRKLYPKKRRKSVDRMTRKELVSNLDAMELPETDARDFDSNEIRDILVDQAPDLFMRNQ